MDRKVVVGLVALGAAVIVFGRRRRSRSFAGLGVAPKGWTPKNKKAWRKGARIERREHGVPMKWARKIAADHLFEKPSFYSGTHGLGFTTERHASELKYVTEEAVHAIADAEWTIAQAIGATKLKAIGIDGKPIDLTPAYGRYHLNRRCEEANLRLGQGFMQLGRMRGESMAAGVSSGFRDLWDDLHKAANEYHKVCHVRKPTGPELDASFGGLGLTDPEHGMKRVYHAVQAGFLQKDAIKFARRGWCDQAFKKLREAEYETGQASGHAKSVTGQLQVTQVTKGKSSRLAMNKATDTVKKFCATHKKRAPRVRGQGDLPF